MTAQIIPGIRQTKPAKNGPESEFKRALFKREGGNLTFDTSESVQAQINTLSTVDPLTYYCAYLLVTGMDEMVTGGGYCQVDGRRYSSLEGAIRAITGDKPVVELGEVVKRKQYKYPRQKKKVRRTRRWKKADVSKEALDRMVELARLLMAQEAAEGEGGEAAG